MRTSSAIHRVVFVSVCLFLGDTAFPQYQNVRVSSPSSTTPEEVTIAINPANPLNLAAGANLRYYYYSTDGGQNWVQGQLTSTYGVWGDPCVIFDGAGNLHYAHLSNYASGYWLDRIVVQKSTNGGSTWSGGVGIGLNPPAQQDKEWLAVDLTNKRTRNNLYITWTEFDSYGSNDPADSSRILCSRSTDLGETWSAPVRVSDSAGDCIDSDNTVEGAVPAVGPNGEIYVSWSGPLGIMFDRSTDAGLTFGQDIFVTSQPGGWDYNVSGIYRANGLPITACDISFSPYRGNVYVQWTDQRNGATNTDVFLIKSTDRGATWGPVKRVNDDSTTRYQFFSWMTVDRMTGYVYVVYYDRRSTTGDATDVYVARSMDGGETFSNVRVSATSFTPVSSEFFGDYTNIAAYNGKVYPIWMRMDGTNLSVWTAIMPDSTTGLAEVEQLPSHYELAQNYPNPFNPTTVIEYTVPAVGSSTVPVRLTVYTVVGQEVAVLVDESRIPGHYQAVFDGRRYPSGMYFYRLRAGANLETKKMILLK